MERHWELARQFVTADHDETKSALQGEIDGDGGERFHGCAKLY